MDLAAPGALLALLAEPGISDLLVNGPDSVWVDGHKGLRRLAVHLGDKAQLRALASRLAAQGGQRLDDASPAADIHLPGGIRMHAVLPPIAVNGPLLSFRLARSEAFTVDQLVEANTMSPAMAKTLVNLVTARVNFLVSGGTGAGKTTLLAALLAKVPPDQRIVVIEEATELVVTHPHLVRLEARAANAEGKGAFTLADLVRQALRMRPDRIVVGECRGAEVRELLLALNTGHGGSCGTIHANSTADVPARLEALGALAGMDGPAVTAQAGAALTAVVHMARNQQGARQVAEVAVLRQANHQLAAVSALSHNGHGTERTQGWDHLAQRCGWPS